MDMDMNTDVQTAMEQRWTEERAQAWYQAQTWICGLNYIPANAISYTEMWMPYNFDIEKIDRELALAEEIGFNALRVVLPFVVWEADPAAFRDRFESFVDTAAKRGMKTVVCFFDDCAFGSDEALKNPVYGQQPDVLEGWYASGWTPSPGHALVRDASAHPRLERYVKDIMKAHRDDDRILFWDLYNEPTNSEMYPASMPLLRKVFAWARDVDPAQPVTTGLWNTSHEDLNDWLKQASDIITFHNYMPPDHLRKQIRDLKALGRPVINTEWLNRGAGSSVEGCLPVFKEENVGCFHWGLVNGRTQTDLNWGHRPGDPAPKQWQHDLFHGDHTPYAEDELELFRKLTGADSSR